MTYQQHSYEALQFELAVRSIVIEEQEKALQPLIDEIQRRDAQAKAEQANAPEQLELFDK